MFRTVSSTSSTERGNSTARFFAAIALLASVAALQGCGFRPLHAQYTAASRPALAQIDIAIIPDRVGQMLRNELLDLMHPRGADGVTPRFNLKIELTESRNDLAIRKDESATRANLALTAHFFVTPYAGDALLFSGTANSIVSHNVLSADYANIAARDNARRRGVRELAMQLTERLSVWLVQNNGNPPLPPSAVKPGPAGSQGLSEGALGGPRSGSQTEPRAPSPAVYGTR